MRLNRTTLILLATCAAIIVGVLALTNNQASAPDAATRAPAVQTAATVGRLLPDLTQDAVVALEIVDNQTGDHVRMARGADDAWAIVRATYSADRATDESAVRNRLETLLTLEANDRFDSDKLADFGLTTPAYVLTLTTQDGTLHTIYVGNANPAGNRRYLFVTQSEPGAATPEPEPTSTPTPETTAEATAEPDAEPTATPSPLPYTPFRLEAASGTVFLVVKSTMDSLTNLVAQPPYVPPPTPTVTPTATLNPLSEVEMATLTAIPYATATAVFERFAATATAQAEATAEATTEATPEAGQ
ncbi:MAG: DUF4340 domain-containing protein [Aggregatilineales bacterium]